VDLNGPITFAIHRVDLNGPITFAIYRVDQNGQSTYCHLTHLPSVLLCTPAPPPLCPKVSAAEVAAQQTGEAGHQSGGTPTGCIERHGWLIVTLMP